MMVVVVEDFLTLPTSLPPFLDPPQILFQGCIIFPFVFSACIRSDSV